MKYLLLVMILSSSAIAQEIVCTPTPVPRPAPTPIRYNKPEITPIICDFEDPKRDIIDKTSNKLFKWSKRRKRVEAEHIYMILWHQAYSECNVQQLRQHVIENFNVLFSYVRRAKKKRALKVLRKIGIVI